MRARCALAVLSLLLCASTALAEQDFYGIKMRNDLWARNLVLNAGPKADDKDLFQGPILDPTVFAEALVRPSGDHTEFMLNVVNNSPQAIPTEYDARDYFLYLKNGKKIPLIDPEAQANLVSVEPKKSMQFTPSLGNLKVRSDEIRMIECSFDLGRTRLFLFPASYKKAINALKNPPLPLVPAKGAKAAPRNFWEWMGMKPKASKVPSADPGGAGTRDRIDKAIHDFKYVPTPAPLAPAPASSAIARKEKNIDRELVVPSTPPEAVRTEARVIEYNKTYNYITLNLGARDGLYPDMLLNILRNGRLVAQARVRQLRDDVSAAAILPEFRTSDVRPGDLVAFV